MDGDDLWPDDTPTARSRIGPGCRSHAQAPSSAEPTSRADDVDEPEPDRSTTTRRRVGRPLGSASRPATGPAAAGSTPTRTRRAPAPATPFRQRVVLALLVCALLTARRRGHLEARGLVGARRDRPRARGLPGLPAPPGPPGGGDPAPAAPPAWPAPGAPRRPTTAISTSGPDADREVGPAAGRQGGLHADPDAVPTRTRCTTSRQVERTPTGRRGRRHHPRPRASASRSACCPPAVAASTTRPPSRRAPCPRCSRPRRPPIPPGTSTGGRGRRRARPARPRHPAGHPTGRGGRVRG